MQLKAPNVAGRFYEADPGRLAAAVDGYLAAARPFPGRPKAIIAPHAGFVYSGPIAGSAYAPLAARRGEIRRVVLFGPAHYGRFRGLALPQADAFQTPLGAVPVDWAWASRILGLPEVSLVDQAFEREHSLETQLPFLQRALGDFSLVPILVGGAAIELVDQALTLLWGGPETAVVISSDLSHYHDYAKAQGLDGAASTAIEMLRPDRLEEPHACGRHGIRGLLVRARALDMRATALDVRNSGDTAGGKDRVVGYGAYAFEYAGEARLTDADRETLLSLAVASIRYRLKHGAAPTRINLADPSPALRACRGAFVTLELDGKLRGCIGSTEPVRPLMEDVVHNAGQAAFADPRFKPLTAAELARLDVSISVLGSRRPVAFASQEDLIAQLRPDRDGVVLMDGRNRGLFLPQVWEGVPEPAQFLTHLKRKAGLPADHWSETIRFDRFTVESFGRKPQRELGPP